MTPADKIAILQRFVDSFGQDLLAVRTALGDTKLPDAAKRVLIGGLNYALDMLDIFPDHYKGLGVADDAIVLRLAAKLAVDAGATDAAVTKLAGEVSDVTNVFGDVVPKLEKLVAGMPDREVRGRTATKILSHKDTFIMFDADVGREAKKYVVQQIDTKVEGPERALVELRKMIDHALSKAGI